MINQKSPRVFYIVFALAVMILSPIIILFFPITVVETIYFSNDNILLLTPINNFYLMIGAMVLIIAILFLLAWKRKIFTYALAVFLAVGSGVMIYTSTLSYTAIQENGIVLKEYHTVNDYAWRDIAEIIYEYDFSSPGVYTFTTTEGETIRIHENGQFTPDKQSAIYSTVMGQGIPFIEREKSSE